MSEVATAFLEEKKNKIKKADGYNLIKERVLKHRVDYQVCLRRFLSNLWNGNGDEWATVYELNNATKDLKGNALDAAVDDILSKKEHFCTLIGFEWNKGIR